MDKQIRDLKPQALWNNFADLNAVPRPSKKERKVIQFIKEFGARLQLETTEDETGNVLIKKQASPGMENRQTVLLQSHLDMVHQKNADTSFDFETQGIEMFADGDWVKAKGTTLGADNGIGVASIMTLLAATEIVHPAIEALFTIDEETGMTGALGFKTGMLKSTIMLNLDTEEDNELTIGCAGGIDITATGTYTLQKREGKRLSGYTISIKGLTGGHSGMDIYYGRGNSNKLMNRLLLEASESFDLCISSIDGGSLRNAIPRESVALVAVPDAQAEAFGDFINEQAAVLKDEHATTDPRLGITLAPAQEPVSFVAREEQHTILRSLDACPNGIFRMSPDIPHLVQTSNNMARVELNDGTYSVLCLTRSSADSEKMDLARAVKSALVLGGATVEFSGSYPGWTPKPGASIVKLMRDLYVEMYSEQPHVNACHAGLECGIIGANYPVMEMISFGPNIRGAHSPDEKVQISSVQKYWEFLLETLKRIPEKNYQSLKHPAAN